MNQVEAAGVRGFLRTIAEKDGLNIVAGSGLTPATDGTTVYLPKFEDCDKDEMLGYAFHEAMHVVHTAFKVGKNNFPALANAIEDTRIERLGCQRYAGGQIILNRRISKLIARGDLCHITPSDTPASVVVTYLCQRGKVKFLESPSELTEFMEATRKNLEARIGEATVAKIDAIHDKGIPKLTNTKSSIELAEKILQCLQEAAEKAQQQGKEDDPNEDQDQDDENEPNGSDESDDSETSNGSSSTNASEPSNGSESDSSDGSDTSDSKDAKASQKSGHAARNSRKSSKFTQAQVASLQAILANRGNGTTVNKMANSIHVDGVEKTPDHHPSCGLGEFVVCGNDKPINKDFPELFEEMEKVRIKALGEALSVRTVLRGLLEAQTRGASRLAARGQRVSPTALSRLSVGNLKVMEKRTEPHKGVETVVEILLDCSGSMGFSTMLTAARVSFILLSAVRGIKGCRAGLATFPSPEPLVTSRLVRDAMEIVAPGKGALSAREIKRVQCIRAVGGTPLNAGITLVLNRFRDCPENRKICIVISDGDASLSNKVVERVHREKAEMYLVQIGMFETPPSVENAMRSIKRIQDTTELKSAVLAFAKAGMTRFVH